MSTALDVLPDAARLWSFGVSRALSEDEVGRLLEEVDAFLEGWKAHGEPLAAAREWRHGRFLLVAVDERISPPSGCSIDALLRRLRELEQELEVTIVGSAPVWYRSEAGIERVSRADFRALAAEGAVGPQTVVFDLSLTRLHEVREGRWEIPAARSWHRRYLPDA